jgi:hypothetical protein
MSTPELKKTPYLWEKSPCGQSSTNESQQFLPIQYEPPFPQAAQQSNLPLACLSQYYWPIISFEVEPSTFSNWSQEPRYSGLRSIPEVGKTLDSAVGSDAV